MNMATSRKSRKNLSIFVVSLVEYFSVQTLFQTPCEHRWRAVLYLRFIIQFLSERFAHLVYSILLGGE